MACFVCKAEGAPYRCMDCAHRPLSCKTCCIEQHKLRPFHRVQKWNGRFFEDFTLWLVGLVLHLGHAGAPCPGRRRF
ncbi:hypothetical protein BKA82DRAFT_3926007, partial [Pisolithus tinctorius]